MKKSLNKTVSYLCLSGVSTYPINNIFVRLTASKGLLNRVNCGVGFKKRVKPLRIKCRLILGLHTEVGLCSGWQINSSYTTVVSECLYLVYN